MVIRYSGSRPLVTTGVATCSTMVLLLGLRIAISLFIKHFLLRLLWLLVKCRLRKFRILLKHMLLLKHLRICTAWWRTLLVLLNFGFCRDILRYLIGLVLEELGVGFKDSGGFLVGDVYVTVGTFSLASYIVIGLFEGRVTEGKSWVVELSFSV